jgi:hypothetical protein
LSNGIFPECLRGGKYFLTSADEVVIIDQILSRENGQETG